MVSYTDGYNILTDLICHAAKALKFPVIDHARHWYHAYLPYRIRTVPRVEEAFITEVLMRSKSESLPYSKVIDDLLASVKLQYEAKLASDSFSILLEARFPDSAFLVQIPFTL
jgi:hypothetical protein